MQFLRKYVTLILGTSIFLSLSRVVESFTGMFVASSRIMRSISGLLGNHKDSGSSVQSSLSDKSSERRVLFDETTRGNRPKSPRTQIKELTQQNAAAYYRNAGFGNPTMQHIETYSAIVDEEEFMESKDKHFLEIMMRTAFESVSTMLTPVKNKNGSKDKKIVEEFICASHSVTGSSSPAAIVNMKGEVKEVDSGRASSVMKSTEESIIVPGFMDYDPKEIMKARNNKILKADGKIPGMMYEHDISPDNVWQNLN